MVHFRDRIRQSDGSYRAAEQHHEPNNNDYKKVKMVAEMSNDMALWIPDTTDRQDDYSAVIALKPPSEFGADTVVGRIPGRLTGESLDRLESPVFRLALQTQEQHVRLDKDQLTTDTADLKMTEEALAEDTAAFEDNARLPGNPGRSREFRGLHQQESV